MAATHPPGTPAEVGTELQAWRSRVLNILLIVVTIAATWRVGQSVIQAIQEPRWWPQTVPYLVVYAFLLALTVLRRLDHRLRAGGLILVGYGMAIMTLSMFGLLGNGLIYLAAMPLLGVFLIGPRTGLAMAAISLVVFGTFAGLAQAGVLADMLLMQTNTTLLSDWLGVGVMFAGLLLMTVILAWLFSRAQTQALVRAHRATARLTAAHDELQARAEGLDQYAHLLETAAGIARDTTSLLDRDALIRQAAEMIAGRLDLNLAAIYLSSPRTGRLELAGAGGPRAGAAPPGAPIAAFRAFADGEVQAEPGERQLALPLDPGRQPVGVLVVQSARPTPISDQEAAALCIIAEQLAVAEQNARLFAQEQASVRELDRLYRQYTADAWQEFGASRVQTAGWETGEEDVPARAWDDLFAAARASGHAERAETAGRRLLAVPIKLRDLTIGVVGFHRPTEAGPWLDEHISAIEAITERLALATDNLRLLDDSRRRAARERLTRRMTDTIRGATSIEDAVRRTVQELAQALGAAEMVARIGPEPELLRDGGGNGHE